MKTLDKIIDEQETQVPKIGLTIASDAEFNMICHCAGYSFETVKKFDRSVDIVFGRYAIWNYFFDNKYSFPELGKLFNRDRNTIRAGVHTYKKLLSIRDKKAIETNAKFRSNMQQLYSKAIEIFMANDYNLE